MATDEQHAGAAPPDSGPAGTATAEDHRKNPAFNAVRTGYYALKAPIPGVDENLFSNKKREWIDFYRPISPIAHSLIDRCVRSTTCFELSSIAQESIILHQLSEADRLLERRRGRQVAGHVQWLSAAPERAAAALRASSLGCRTLTGKLEAIGSLLDQAGYLESPELGALLNLFGASTEPATLKQAPSAYVLMLLNLHAVPRDSAGEAARAVADLTRPEFRPEAFQGKDLSFPILSRPQAAAKIRALLDEELESLMALERHLRTGKEAEERERVLKPCLMIYDDHERRSYFQSMSDTRSSFHRALRDLMTTLSRDAAAAQEEPARGGEAGPRAAGSAGGASSENGMAGDPEVADCQAVTPSVVETLSVSLPPSRAAAEPARRGAADAGLARAPEQPARPDPEVWGDRDPLLFSAFGPGARAVARGPDA